ncbi:Uncharacterised protein [uncultured archaeon]|nr:Uncharacterised protein [uncultured archaeon]
MDFFGSFFGSPQPKGKLDYSAELAKVKKDYDELRGLMEDWKKLPMLQSYQKRLDALQDENYHPVVLLIVGHAVKDFYNSVEFYIKKLELAVQGDIDAMNYIEETKKNIHSVLESYKRRLQIKLQDIIEASQKVADWPAIKAKILSDIDTQKNIVKVYIPKEGEEETKREWFTKERLNCLNSRSKSYPARLVWALEPGQVYIVKYLNLLDQIIAADEESREKLVVDLKNLEADIELFLEREFFRVKNKYSYLKID